jgi:drug/metabolite transporter (DMT)-like permease
MIGDRTRGLFQLHVACVGFGFAALFARFVSVPSIVIVVGRMAVAALVLLAVLACTRRRLAFGGPRDYLALAVVGSLMGLSFASLFEAVRASSVAVAVLAMASCPIMVVLAEAGLERVRPRPGDLGLALAALGGMALLVPSFQLGDRAVQGVLWGLLCAATYAAFTLGNRSLSQRYSSLEITFVEDAAAALLLLPFAVASAPSISGHDVLLLVAFGVGLTAVPHALFVGGMRHVPARQASVIANMEPVYAIALATLLLGEVPTARTIVGGLVVLAAVFATTVRGGRTRGTAQAEPTQDARAEPLPAVAA